MPTKTSGGERVQRLASERRKPQQARHVPEWLDQAHDGQRLGILESLAAGGNHRRAGHALEGRGRHARAKRIDQACAQQVAGCLTSNQCDLHRV